MSGFCELCGKPIKKGLCPDGNCPNSIHESGAVPGLGSVASHASSPEIGPVLPKPSTPRRLLGSGIEFTFYAFCFWSIVFLDLVTGGLLGLLCLILFGLIVLRDFNNGAFSIAKRVSQMRVVDWGTGRSPSNIQAFLRNSYYIGLLLLAVIPAIDCIFASLFMLFITLDITMILASHQGRRLGDLLASTQVIEARS